MAKAKKADGVVGVRMRWKKGFGERIVDDLVWSSANNYEVIVTDQAMVERLAANGDFEVIAEAAEDVDGTE